FKLATNIRERAGPKVYIICFPVMNYTIIYIRVRTSSGTLATGLRTGVIFMFLELKEGILPYWFFIIAARFICLLNVLIIIPIFKELIVEDAQILQLTCLVLNLLADAQILHHENTCFG
ncbi:hypothetical protein ACJX0J_038493, partial [Zea mays]